MPSQVFNRHYWSARELVVLGVFSAAAKLSTLLVRWWGRMNPVSLLARTSFSPRCSWSCSIRYASRGRWPCSCS
ncbi:MAG: hypothetical protein ACLSAH_08950 [Bilophila wadsworthia]